MDKKSLSHTAWKCQYHIVFIPKYRKKVLFGQVWADVRDIIKTLCQYTAQVEHIGFHGVLEREEYSDDI